VRRSLESCRLLAVAGRDSGQLMARSLDCAASGNIPQDAPLRTAESRLECWLGALGFGFALRSPGGFAFPLLVWSREKTPAQPPCSPVFSSRRPETASADVRSYGAADQDGQTAMLTWEAGGPSHRCCRYLP